LPQQCISGGLAALHSAASRGGWQPDTHHSGSRSGQAPLRSLRLDARRTRHSEEDQPDAVSAGANASAALPARGWFACSVLAGCATSNSQSVGVQFQRRHASGGANPAAAVPPSKGKKAPAAAAPAAEVDEWSIVKTMAQHVW